MPTADSAELGSRIYSSGIRYLSALSLSLASKGKMPTRHQPTLILWALLLACGGDTAPPCDIEVHISDSAGVRIVQYLSAPYGDLPFTLAEEPIYRRGANPGDYIFQFVDASRPAAAREENPICIVGPSIPSEDIV